MSRTHAQIGDAIATLITRRKRGGNDTPERARNDEAAFAKDRAILCAVES